MKKFWMPVIRLMAVPLLFAGSVVQNSAALGPQTNLRFGPIDFNLTGTFTVEHNDNILSSPKGLALSDVILTPGFDFAGSWKITKFNTLKLDLGLGYQFYINNPQLGSSNNFINMSPDTKLELKMKMGAFTITPYDSLTFSTDSAGVPGVDAATEIKETPTTYARFNNEFGLKIIWHMNRKAEPYLRLYRMDVIPIKGDTFNYTQRYQYTLNPGFNFDVATNLRLGFDFNVTKNYYKTNFQNDSTTFNAGPTFNWGISSNINFAGGVGYSWSQFKNNGLNRDNSQPQNLSWNLNFVHTLSPTLQYTIFTTQSSAFGYIANSTKTRNVGASIQWRALRRTTLRAALVNSHGSDSGGFFAEKYRSITGGFGFDYALNSRSTLSFDYEHTKKSSDRQVRGYAQNRIIAGLAYDF